VISRTKLLVLGFFAAAWLSFLVVLALAPAVYDNALTLGPGDHHAADIAFLAALTAFLVLVSYGVLRSSRWMFWLILVAFLAGIIRVPAATLQLTGVLPQDGPAWYEIFQGVIGVVQFVIGLAMLAGYRKAGAWGDL
jgi:hypothetical protein